MTPMIAAIIVAAIANIAAVIAIIFARRELDKAERAIESVSSSRASRRSAAVAVNLASSASIQARTSCLRTECWVEPCKSVVAISSLAAAGPILERRSSSSIGIGMANLFVRAIKRCDQRNDADGETPNV